MLMEAANELRTGAEATAEHAVAAVVASRRGCDETVDSLNQSLASDRAAFSDLANTVAATSARDFTRAGEVFWHLNVWSSGRICLNLLNEPDGTWHGQWSPSITIKQILCAIQELLDNPFPAGARPEVQTLYERNRPAYERRLRQEADKYRKRPLPDDDDDVVVIE